MNENKHFGRTSDLLTAHRYNVHVPCHGCQIKRLIAVIIVVFWHLTPCYELKSCEPSPLYSDHLDCAFVMQFLNL